MALNKEKKNLKWCKGIPLGPSFSAVDAGLLPSAFCRRPAPRVSRPPHGEFLEPSARSLPPPAAATKSSFDGFLWSVLHQQVAHYIFLIQRCSQPSTVVPLCGEGRGERSRSRWSKQSQLADSTVFTTFNSFQRCCSLACLVSSRCSRHKAQFPLRGAPRRPKCQRLRIPVKIEKI